MSFFYVLANILGPLMKVLYNFIGNYGITMIISTVIIKLIAFPLAIYQQKSTAKMSVFQPLINEIQTKYKNNPEKQQEELLKLQQEHGYNPMAGCLPMLLNFLILFGIIGVVYYPVHYMFGVSNTNVKAACEALGLATTGANVQTSLIQAFHNGASVSTDLISAEVQSQLAAFNTNLFGMDICEVTGFRLTPLLVFPVVATLTMFVSFGLTQHLSGMGNQMQGSMKVTMWAMNLFFVYYCFNAPIGFCLYYIVSNLFQIGQSFVTYRIYSPEKFKAQYEAELAAKRAAKKAKKTFTVEENGKQVKKELSGKEADNLRLELARRQDADLYADERTEPLKK